MLFTLPRSEIMRQRELDRAEAAKDPTVIFLDGGDDVVCDQCNAEITDDPVTGTTNGSLGGPDALCADCTKAAVARGERWGIRS